MAGRRNGGSESGHEKVQYNGHCSGPCCLAAAFRRRWATILAQSLLRSSAILYSKVSPTFWYLEARRSCCGSEGVADLNDKIALISANAASKVVLFRDHFKSHTT